MELFLLVGDECPAQTHSQLIHRALRSKVDCRRRLSGAESGMCGTMLAAFSLFLHLLTVGVILTKSELMIMCHIPTGQLAGWEVAFWRITHFP